MMLAPTERLSTLVCACSAYVDSEEAKDCLLGIEETLEELAILGMSPSRYWSTVEFDDDEDALAFVARDALSTKNLLTWLTSDGPMAIAVRETLRRLT